MSDPPETGGAAGAVDGGLPASLSPDAIEAVLNDFRTWLQALAQQSGVRSQESGVRTPQVGTLTAEVDLFTLVGQFTALRHEVNLQTRAARAAVEQNAEVLKQLTALPEPEEDDDAKQLRPLLKAMVDIADALALSRRQMEKFRDSVEPLLADLVEVNDANSGEADPPRPRFLARLFGAAPPPSPPPDRRRNERGEQAAEKLRQLAAAAADGYTMSLRRVERVLPTFELEPISCIGEAFDPELMEVVEVAADTDQPPGTVVEEVRPGYRWRGKVFRFAQVKVAR